MTVVAGTRFGVYELLSPVGAGGMGEVYRARDSRLGRDVALKILPAGFAANDRFRVRFDREARAIASLNHPHICTIHDVGSQDGRDYLVMELLEGESLARRLQRGPLPLDEVLRYGAQIATALDAAHRKRIIHRDLKPGNVMITKTGAKLLDFGLAKSSEEQRGVVAGLTDSATRSVPLTAEGAILGTCQYMAPEQLEGAPADARTDIFALGAVLYEMTTAKRAFEGSTRTSLIAAIVSAQPAPISEIVPMTPPALDHVIRKCLEKEPDARWQSAHDVASELRWISEGGSQAGAPAALARARRWKRAAMVALAVVGIAAITVAGLFVRERTITAAAKTLFRSDLVLPAASPIEGASRGPMLFSPDGGRLLFATRSPETRSTATGRRGASGELAVHDFGSGIWIAIAGTRGATFPFWSPDGEWVAFFADGKLKKVAASGGPVQVLCDAPQGRGGTWGRKGVIVFAPEIYGPLMRVPEAGGTPVPATEGVTDEWTHRNPHFLPDGEHFLLTANDNNDHMNSRVAVASLRDPAIRMLDVTGGQPQYAAGYLFFVSDGNLIAQRFDVAKAAVVGAPTPIADRIEVYLPRQTAHVSVSSTGVLAYRQRSFSPAQFVWMDRSGRELEASGEPGHYVGARVSGDGRTATLVRREDSEERSVWRMDLASGNVTRLTRNLSALAVQAVPSHSGDRIAVSIRGGAPGMKSGAWIQTASTETPTMLAPALYASDWSRDGRILIGQTQKNGTAHDIVWLTVENPREIHRFAETAANEFGGLLSPDGRWLAYASNETGSFETYISDFPEGKKRWQVTRSGEVSPRAWSIDGRELFYAGPGGTGVVSVRDNGETLEIGDPVAISIPDQAYVVWGDADRLLVLKSLSAATGEPIRIVRNWKKLLDK